MKDQEKLIKRANSALLDIHRGYSVLSVASRDFYFKHFNLIDVLKMDEEYSQAIRHANNSGIKSEKELIAQSIKRGKWSISKEEEQKSLQWTIGKLQIAEDKASDPNIKKSILASIEDKKLAIANLQKERHQITSFSAENFADNKRIKFLVENSCYLDSKFEEKIDSDDFFDVSVLCFSKIGEFNQRDFMLNVAYNTAFFELFILHYRQPDVIFGKAGLALTVFQKNLLVYSNSLLNKLKNTSIPDSIANDPVKVLEYDEKKEKGGKTSQGIDDLKEKAKARGGVLKPEDFLD